MRRLSLLALVLATAGAFNAAAAVPVLEPSETQLFLRNEGTGCPGDPYIGTEAGTGEPGCGYQGGAPVRELTHSGAPVASDYRTYETRDVPVQILDATRDVAGVNRVVATATTNRMAVGQVRVDVQLLGLRATGGDVLLGSHTSEVIVNPTNSAEVDFPFTINVPDSLDKTRLTGVKAVVDIRGWHVLTGYHRLNGQSHFTLPTYIEVEQEG